jgi:hypothetical protein
VWLARSYHALLSSGALPGGLLDPGHLAKLRAELLAAAAGVVTAAAVSICAAGLKAFTHCTGSVATSGIGYSDVTRVTSDQGQFKCGRAAQCLPTQQHPLPPKLMLLLLPSAGPS